MTGDVVAGGLGWVVHRQHILRTEGLGRLDRGDRATDRDPVRRYQRDQPGELIHVDIKNIAAIPPGGGWRAPWPRQRRHPWPQRRRLPRHPSEPFDVGT